MSGDVSPSRFHKLTENPEILVKIFHHLTFVDQLRLARVDFNFGEIFKTFIWPTRYRALEIICNNSKDFVVMNETKSDLLKLNSQESDEFLKLYANDIEELTDRRQWRQSSQNSPQIFPHLSHLNLGKRGMEEQPIEFVARHFQHLKSFQVYIKTSGDICLQEILQVRGLMQLGDLRHLVLEADINVAITLGDMRLLITQMKLQKLVLGAAVLFLNEHDDGHVDFQESQNIAPSSLTELDVIVSNVQPSCWLRNLELCFSNCQNLTCLKLEIQGPTALNDEALHILCRLCENLKKFSIFNSCIEAENLPLPCVLTELGIYHCQVFTDENLREILKHRNLKKFKSLYTRYQRRQSIAHDSTPWPCLEVLESDEWATQHLQHIFRGNGNLKRLRWHKTIDDAKNIALDGRLADCRNLQQLEWHGAIPLETLQKFQHLRILSIAVSRNDIVSLLKLPHISELTIRQTWGVFSTKPVMGFITNLHSLHISRSIIMEAMDFWLDLLGHNPQMTLICNYHAKELKRNDQFLKRIVKHQLLPPDIDFIHIWGYKIACHRIRHRYEETFSKILHDTEPYRDISFKDMQRIVLQRSHYLHSDMDAASQLNQAQLYTPSVHTKC